MSETESTLPPNQQPAAPGRWPVVGERAPRRSDEPWRVSVSGLVAAPKTWTLDEIAAMPRVEQAVDIHCVTRWSKLGAKFSGVPLARLLGECRPLPEARFLSFVARSERGHSTSLPLAEAARAGALVALRYEGVPLEEAHGGPVRVVVPGRYFYKSVKWLERVEVLAEDRLGYWEQEAGYHNEADPWREQRYIAPNLDRRALADALARRDFRDKDFRSLDATGLELLGLDARGALLRDADFRGVSLAGARFDGANLSNAHLEGANLRGASFVGADVEGADFRGADLRGADFTRASMIAATFVDEADVATFARIDRTTVIEESSVEMLTPAQQSFVRQALARNA
ncbi:MAG TPA: molybdopterin-dependent oxidoreductase [Pyrinomonadaceae bacterium]